MPTSGLATAFAVLAVWAVGCGPVIAGTAKPAPHLTPTPQARAIGVRLNRIVEVEMVFFGDRRASDPGTANPDLSAVDMAQAMMEKVSDPS